MTGTRTEANKHRGMKDRQPWYPWRHSVTAQDALTFHRPPREYPPAVPSERLRIAPPPVQPPPAHTSIIQLLFPVVGGVSMVGFALVYRNTLFLYIAGGMIALLLLFSLGMRWSQKRQVRKRAADEARRYAKYLRERDTELAQAGELQRGALARLYPDPGRLWTLLVKRANVWERRPDHRDFLHVRLGTGARAARPRDRLRPRHEPARRVPAALAPGGAQARRAERHAAR